METSVAHARPASSFYACETVWGQVRVGDVIVKQHEQHSYVSVVKTISQHNGVLRVKLLRTKFKQECKFDEVEKTIVVNWDTVVAKHNDKSVSIFRFARVKSQHNRK